MTKINEILEIFFLSSKGGLFRRIHQELTSVGLKAKDNRKTVLYHFGSQANGENSLAAIRIEPAEVFSLPRAYWESRAGERNALLRRFLSTELRTPNNGPSERYSGGQILVDAQTIERIIELIRDNIGPRVNR